MYKLTTNLCLNLPIPPYTRIERNGNKVKKEKEFIEKLVFDTDTKIFNVSPACSDLITPIDSSVASPSKVRKATT
ncbi:hypothetical protein RO3G_02929 [Rhizopus delemar RA 99-880]|uniref:Uncharacterized protein n=1 Tax=Rhizopus delemar (strain RA 99-880 / ATCC MYA-4621 / FGSC 9543 / NRRL 43880) TaxID=246409 RepID=I1BPU5_RHIO9|nr:hypothetical protein RO3G_02929 [Rhizopus delemar RA 99-880]|eukprot:EIE78225.1 hypothetical protein RO3G_02929 [Rhizopus delemar RA 99-880]